MARNHVRQLECQKTNHAHGMFSISSPVFIKAVEQVLNRLLLHELTNYQNFSNREDRSLGIFILPENQNKYHTIGRHCPDRAVGTMFKSKLDDVQKIVEAEATQLEALHNCIPACRLASPAGQLQQPTGAAS